MTYKLVYTGDLVLQNTEYFKEKYLYKDFRRIIDAEKADLIINLESPFINKGMVKQKNKICLYSCLDRISHLKYLSPKLINLSNNHINDYGNESCKLTFKTLENYNLKFFGVGTITDKKNHIYIDHENKIIQLAYLERSSDFTGSKLFSEENFIGGYPVNFNEIKTIKETYSQYLAVVNIHWGIEDIKYPEPEKRKLAYKIIDVGADMIIGHHPHIIQPIEKYKNKLIFYSLGNFYFPNIKFEIDGILKNKKAVNHQRKGVVPILKLENNNLCLDKVLKIIRNRKGNRIQVKYQDSNPLFNIPSINGYEKWFNSYYKRKRYVDKILIVMRNPFKLFRKLKKTINNLYKNTDIGFVLVHPVKKLYDFFRYRILPKKIRIKLKYKKALGVYPNLKNPTLFTEKIQWLKLYDKNPLKTICADKYRVRDYVKSKVGEKYLIPFVFETKNVKDINAENLPNYPVILKANHDSGGGMIIKNKYDIDYKQLHRHLNIRLKRNYYYESTEWEYKNIEPRIIVEKLLKDESNNQILNDYKIYCFNGQPKYVQTFFDRKTYPKETWYDLEWNQLQNVWYYGKGKKDIPKPIVLNEMLKTAEILSADFVYVRVDLYLTHDRLYFGELTFHPFRGFMKWRPKEWDEKLGNLLKLPKN